DSLIAGNSPTLEMTVEVAQKVTASFEVMMRDANSAPVMFGLVGLSSGFKYSFEPGTYRVAFKLQLPLLAEGRYSLDLMTVEFGVRFFDYLEEALIINVLPANNANTGWEFKQSRGQGCILLETTHPEVSVLTGDAVEQLQ